MASADQFAVTPYSFEPEYEKGEGSSNLTTGKYSDGSGEDIVGRLATLDWCKCSNCTTTTLNHPRECLCCRKVAEASALADFNSKPISCIVEHNDFRAVCLTRAVLKTTLVRIKNLVQGMDLSAAELPSEYV